MDKKRYIIKIDDPSQGVQGPQGPQGPPGSVDLPINTSDIIHDGALANGLSLDTIIDSLLFIPLEILTFSINGTSIFEKGTVLTSIQLQWTYNKIITIQSLVSAFNSPASVASTLRIYTLTLSNANVTFNIELTSGDGSSNPDITRAVTVSFLPAYYYGKSIIPGSVNNSFLLTLSKRLTTNRAYEFQIDLEVDEYGWIAIPSLFNSGSSPTFFINGYLTSMIEVSTFSHTNAAGGTENYTVYRTEFSNLGLTTIKIV